MSSSASTPVRAPKAMSSRLLTMKFMQRAAASPASPSTPDEPSAKRQKTDAKAADSPLSAFDVSSLADARAVEQALAAEEAKRQIVLNRQAAEAGDTRWVINFEGSGNARGNGSENGLGEKGEEERRPALRVMQAGFAAIDRGLGGRVLEEEADQPVMAGRRSFGKFNRKLEKLQNPDNTSDSDSDEEGDDDDGDNDEDSDDPTHQLLKSVKDENVKKLREERKAKRKAEKTELLRLAEKRKEKDVKLNRLSSISNSNGGTSNKTKQSCHKCGEVGHLIAECPKRRERGDDDNDAQRRNRKKRKSG